MAHGYAERRRLSGIEELATLIENLEPHQALTLGRMRAGIPDSVAVLSEKKLREGGAGPNTITRTLENFVFDPGRPAFALLDYDPKNMPASVAEKLAAVGGFWPALVGVWGLARSARLLRASTSTGLWRTDTGEKFTGSGGLHVYLPVADGGDIPRFLKALSDRCWLAGLGWIVLSKSGAYLERSIIDVAVGTPERLVFEGQPIIEPPLAQDEAGRRPIIIGGE